MNKLMLLFFFVLANINCLGGNRVLANFELLEFKKNKNNNGFTFSDSIDGKIKFNIDSGNWAINSQQPYYYVRKVIFTENNLKHEIGYTCLKTAIVWDNKKQINEFHEMHTMNQNEYQSKYTLLGFNYNKVFTPSYSYILTDNNFSIRYFEYYSNQCYVSISYKFPINDSNNKWYDSFMNSLIHY
ncbi:MAG: hypothetical protein JW915_22525 [Chitinispirillaceae bacterium]|nr:hypothetical protein [Chitinispirillaceae bacterium]